MTTQPDTTMRVMRLAAAGFTCAQILISMALEDRDEENPALVRAAAGLAYGCGTGCGDCGVLTGGCCVLGLYAAKGSADETESERFPLMLQEFTDWFRERAAAPEGAVSCDAITGPEGPVAARSRCGALVMETHERLVELLAAHDLYPPHA